MASSNRRPPAANERSTGDARVTGLTNKRRRSFRLSLTASKAGAVGRGGVPGGGLGAVSRVEVLDLMPKWGPPCKSLGPVEAFLFKRQNREMLSEDHLGEGATAT